MRTETDALLSLQRAVAAALPDFDEIVTEADGSQARPFAVVSADGDGATDGTHASRWHTLPVTVYAYVRGDTRVAARKAAEDARDALWRLFDAGPVVRHVELYDYTGRPAVQRIAITGATGGTWTAELDGDVTPPLGRNAQPPDVLAALEGLAGVGPGNLRIFGRAGGPWAVRFDGDLRGQAIPELVIDSAQLVGPAPAADVAVLSEGSPDPWRDARDYLRIDQANYGGLRDPADPLLRTVTVGVRLTWGRVSHVPSAEMTHTAITARPAP